MHTHTKHPPPSANVKLPTFPLSPPPPKRNQQKPRHAQRTNERRFHIALTWCLGAACLYALPLALQSFVAGFVIIVLACVGVFGAEGLMFAHFLALQGGEKGIGLAIANSAGALGGFVGPVLIGALKQKFGTYSTAMYVLASFVATAAALMAALSPAWAEKWVERGRRRDAEEEAARARLEAEEGAAAAAAAGAPPAKPAVAAAAPAANGGATRTGGEVVCISQL